MLPALQRGFKLTQPALDPVFHMSRSAQCAGRRSIVHHHMHYGLLPQWRKRNSSRMLGAVNGFPADRLAGDKLRDSRVPLKVFSVHARPPARTFAGQVDPRDEINPLRQPLQAGPCAEHHVHRAANVDAFFQPQHVLTRALCEPSRRQRSSHGRYARDSSGGKPEFFPRHDFFSQMQGWRRNGTTQVAHIPPQNWFAKMIWTFFSTLSNRKDPFSTGNPLKETRHFLKCLCASAIVFSHEREMFNGRGASVNRRRAPLSSAGV